MNQLFWKNNFISVPLSPLNLEVISIYYQIIHMSKGKRYVALAVPIIESVLDRFCGQLIACMYLAKICSYGCDNWFYWEMISEASGGGGLVRITGGPSGRFYHGWPLSDRPGRREVLIVVSVEDSIHYGYLNSKKIIFITMCLSWTPINDMPSKKLPYRQ